MWPFDIFAKRRAAEAKRQAERAAHMDRIKASIEAKVLLQMGRATSFDQSKFYRPSAAAIAQLQAGSRAAGAGTSSSAFDDILSPLSPLSPLNPANQFGVYMPPPDEPRHSAPSHCASSSVSHSHDSSPSYSSSDHGSSSHSHSSHDHSCSSSGYDSGSSSSYDSGSSSSSSDW